MKATDFVVKTTKEYVEQMPKAQRKNGPIFHKCRNSTLHGRAI